jgi:hypothetical protein
MSEILEYIKTQKDTKIKVREELELVELGKQNIATQTKKAEESIAKEVVYIEAFKIMRDDIFDLGIENEVLRDKLGQIDEK